MRFSITVNGHLLEYIKEDGVSYSPDFRVEKSVTTANGTLYTRSVEKQLWSIDMLDMDDQYYTEVIGYLRSANPLPCVITNLDDGSSVSKYYYVKIKSMGIKRVIGDITNVKGFSFELREK